MMLFREATDTAESPPCCCNYGGSLRAVLFCMCHTGLGAEAPYHRGLLDIMLHSENRFDHLFFLLTLGKRPNFCAP